MHRVFLLMLITALAHEVGGRAAEPRGASKAVMVMFQNTCVQCHGAKGEGNEALKAPPIAGLPAWYVRAQMENFRAGRRGSHPEDIAGQLMRSMSLVLGAEKIEDLAKVVEAMPRGATPHPPKRDVNAGERLYTERCAECHRYNGTGELVFGSAPLAALPDWYLAAQLHKFKNGQRGAAPGDANGQKMILAATYIEDEAMLESVVSYIMTLSEEKPEAAFGK